MNWKWPSTKENALVPWYAVVRRCLGFCLIMPGMIIMVTGAALGYGMSEAVDLWRKVW